MKLIIQIPCYNEADTLAGVINDLPRQLEGIDQIEYLVIDDGSGDDTAEVARRLDVHHVVSLGSNRGLAAAFLAGIEKCLELGADIIVNTDGDNQYRGDCIKDLVAPVIQSRLDIVVGARPIETIGHFSWPKKKLQRIGSLVVRQFSGTDIPDTTSGFRAYSAAAAMKLHVFNQYTYTLETIIQAGHMNMRIGHVPVQVNPKTRESRLISSIPLYVWRSVSIILRSYVMYKPLRTFFYFSLTPGFAGLVLYLRFFYFFVMKGSGAGHVQSLILGTMLLIVSFLLLSLGILGDLISANQRLIQDSIFVTRWKSYKENTTARDRGENHR
jgi:glycosyltransferase involved in cell wall biosynthesis